MEYQKIANLLDNEASDHHLNLNQKRGSKQMMKKKNHMILVVVILDLKLQY